MTLNKIYTSRSKLYINKKYYTVRQYKNYMYVCTKTQTLVYVKKIDKIKGIDSSTIIAWKTSVLYICQWTDYLDKR